ASGQFEIMKESVARITPDRRLQVLLVAFCFGAFIEGAAGFGAPVAIAGAFMIGLGFKPFHAAALNLIANTAPVAWGAIGTPVHIVLQFWKPKKTWRFDYDDKAPVRTVASPEIVDQVGGEWSAGQFDDSVHMRRYTTAQVLKAWMPFAVLSIFVLLWGLPSVK